MSMQGYRGFVSDADAAYDKAWNDAVDASIAEAKNQDRTGREWVRDSLWDAIIRRVPASLEKLKRA